MAEDLSKLTGEVYRQWEKSMTAWWDQVLESPSFLQGVNQNLSAQTKARRGFEDQVDQTLAQWHLPSRTDVVRVAKIASMLEDRLLSMEDRLLEETDRRNRSEREALQGRLEIMEALVGLSERLQALEQRLEALAGDDARARRPRRGAE